VDRLPVRLYSPAVLECKITYIVGFFQITLERPSPGRRSSYPTYRRRTGSEPQTTVVLRQQHKWVSPATEQRIEEAWRPRGLRQICQVCQIGCPSHRALRLHVDAHFLFHFCPCGFHDVFLYPVTLHKIDCFAGESHVVDQDCFPQYVDAIRPVIKKAITLAALDVGFQRLLITARQ